MVINTIDDEFEIQITNRFSDLDDDICGGEAMDDDPVESSSSSTVQATNNIKLQENLA